MCVFGHVDPDCLPLSNGNLGCLKARNLCQGMNAHTDLFMERKLSLTPGTPTEDSHPLTLSKHTAIWGGLLLPQLCVRRSSPPCYRRTTSGRGFPLTCSQCLGTLYCLLLSGEAKLSNKLVHGMLGHFTDFQAALAFHSVSERRSNLIEQVRMMQLK